MSAIPSASSTSGADRIPPAAVAARELLRECRHAQLLNHAQADQVDALIAEASRPGISFDVLVPASIADGLPSVVPACSVGDAARAALPCRLGTVSATVDGVSGGRGPLVWMIDTWEADAVRRAALRFGQRPVVLIHAGPLPADAAPPAEWLIETVSALSDTGKAWLDTANAAVANVLARLSADVRMKLTAADEQALAALAAMLHRLLADKRRVVALRLAAVTGELEAAEASRQDPGSSRAVLDTLKAAIESKADDLMSTAQVSLADWFGGRGKLTQSVLSSVRDLGDADFETEESYSRLIRRLSPRVVSEIKIRFQQNARELFRAATGASRDAVSKLEQDFFTRCKALGFERLGYQGISVDEDRAWAGVKGQLEVPVDFKFEQPKRGVLKRLSEGRSLMSSAMMVLTMGGMVAGFQWRKSQEILYLLPVLFIAGIAWSFKSWKEEDQEFIARELDRIRETMTRDLSRTLADSEKAIVAYLRTSIMSSAKHLQQFAELQIKDAGSRQSAESNDRRTRLKDQARRLDGELRGLDQALARGRPLR